MALIRLAFGVSSMPGEWGRGGAECTDIHSYSQQSAGVPCRAGTAVIIYAFGVGEFSAHIPRLRATRIAKAAKWRVS
jgi:hypothetical protein